MNHVLKPPAGASAPAATAHADAAKAPDGRKRVRKYHPRGFSGCSTCKTRHVKCDEETPTCRNCMRLGLQCDGRQGLSMFKMYDAGQVQKDSNNSNAVTKAPRKSKAKAKAAAPVRAAAVVPILHREGSSNESKSESERSDEGDEKEDWAVEVVPRQKDRVLTDFGTVQSWDMSYHAHFLDTVSTILIIWDAPHNLNPFRKCIPRFAQSSYPLLEAMKALGALHAANTSVGPDRAQHMQNAVDKYSSIIQSLREKWDNNPPRPRLDDLAVCLLLCLYEMMDSKSDNWKVHLRGARDIYNMIFNANTGELDENEGEDMEADRPFRRFLVSLMSYLDVAGACSSGEGTMVPGNYWESHGGWEYNLGVSSWVTESRTNHLALTQIRQAWSALMAIQADVSAFTQLKRQGGVSPQRRRMTRSDLETRLANWALNAPPAFAQVDTLEDGVDNGGDQILECAGCVKAYERATLIYCYRCTAEAGDRSPEMERVIDKSCDRILFLIRRLATGVGQLGMLWAMFVAGTQVSDAERQGWIRSRLVEWSRFGFGNVNRALENLERIWAMKKVSPEYDWYQDMSFHREPAFLMP